MNSGGDDRPGSTENALPLVREKCNKLLSHAVFRRVALRDVLDIPVILEDGNFAAQISMVVTPIYKLRIWSRIEALVRHEELSVVRVLHEVVPYLRQQIGHGFENLLKPSHLGPERLAAPALISEPSGPISAAGSGQHTAKKCPNVGHKGHEHHHTIFEEVLAPRQQ